MADEPAKQPDPHGDDDDPVTTYGEPMSPIDGTGQWVEAQPAPRPGPPHGGDG